MGAPLLVCFGLFFVGQWDREGTKDDLPTQPSERATRLYRAHAWAEQTVLPENLKSRAQVVHVPLK